VRSLRQASKIWHKSGSLIFCLLWGVCANSFAQKISEVRYTYYVSETKYEIIQWNIRNDTNEKILLWLEKDTAFQKKSIGDKVRKYFFSAEGDFALSLLRVITEYGSTLTGFETVLFTSFYKIIEPQKSFSIQVICKIPYNRNVVKSLKEMIITTTPTQMEKEKLNIFKIAGLERLSFQPVTLVINDVDL